MFITQLMKFTNIGISLHPNVKISSEDNTHYLTFAPQHFVIEAVAAELLQSIPTHKAIPLPSVREEIGRIGGSHSLILLVANLIYWNHLRLHIIDENQTILLSIENAGHGGNPIDFSDAVTDYRTLRMSRFSSLKREDDDLILWRPMRDKRFIIKDDRLAPFVFSLFSGNCTADSIAGEHKTAVDLMVRLFVNEGIVVHQHGDKAPTRLDEGTLVEAQWDSADLTFHSSSRLGYHYGDFGGAFPFIDLIEPRPAIKPLPEGERIDLYRPSIEDMTAKDISLSEAQLCRISVRQYDEDNPISRKQLGEFLFRTARGFV